MKLSEAILLGSTQLKLNPLYWICDDGGCLIGMAGRAAGIRGTNLEEDDFIDLVVERWPWLDKSIDTPDFIKALPVADSDYPFADAPRWSRVNGKGIVSCLAVHVKLGTITMEQAVEYVASIEPAEPEETETIITGGTDTVILQTGE